MLEVFKLVLWQAAPELDVDLGRIGHLGRGKERACGQVPRLIVRRAAGFDHVVHRQRVNLVPGLHHFLFEVEKDLGETWLLFGQRKDRLIHHLHSERRLNTLAARVGHVKPNARICTGLVGR